jgi:uncharacterized membrane protein
MLSKLKNYGFWVSLFSLISLILANYGLYDAIGMTSDTFQTVVNAFLGLLVTAGIISNPASGTGFTDKEE